MANSTTKEPTVSVGDLKKSVDDLAALLSAEAPAIEADNGEVIEKSIDTIGTNGALVSETGAPNLDPTLKPTEPEEDGEGLTKSDPNEVAGLEAHAELGGDEDDEEFAKSLAKAFGEQEVVTELARKDEFAKALVLGTIESLSLANSEMQKSLTDFEGRQDEKIETLTKSLITLNAAVAEIHKQVVAVSNAPVRSTGKSVKKVGALEKSFGSETNGDTLSKARVLEWLTNEAMNNRATSFDVIRFESSGTLSQELTAKVQRELGSN